jgi:predicted RecB family nuclease
VRLESGSVVLSATDLSNFLNCRYRTALDLGAALGKRRRPVWSDSLLDALYARGLEHERRYVDKLRRAGRDVTDLRDIEPPSEAVVATIDAMRGSADVIVQGALGDGSWYGRPDVLLRVPGDSAFGAWRYEIADTKLALETRAGTVLQMGLYCELLAGLQGVAPEYFYVVTPDALEPVRRYRADDYAAYFRLLRRGLQVTVAGGDEALAASSYPEPVDHCDACPWLPDCRDRRRADDHLSLVAGSTRMQRAELANHGISTVAGLAAAPLPLPFRPRRGASESYVRIREQARLQVQARVAGAPGFEPILPIEAGKGLCLLPPPSPGDLFLDLEGDPFAGENGREYLFGVVSLNGDGRSEYRYRWALDLASEARALDEIVAIIMDVWATYPDMHVYHYGVYEPAALKRLMGRFARCEQDIDRLLRAGRFVDLLAIVRHGIRAGVERYSLKSLEPLYGFERRVPLLDANRSLRAMEQALELDLPALMTPEVQEIIRGYNEEDCVSAWRLRDWLEQTRTQLEQSGHTIPRPAPREDDASSGVTEREQRVAALRERLLHGVPLDRGSRNDDHEARWVLAYLLDWHRREEKAIWWEYFRLRDLPEEDLFDEPQAVAGMEHVQRVEIVLSKKGRPTGSVVDRYRYPVQEMDIRRGDELKLKDERKFGEVVSVDRALRTIDVRKGPSMIDVHLSSAFQHTYFSTEVIENAIFAIGETVANGGSNVLAQRLLRADPPNTPSDSFITGARADATAFSIRTALDLENSVLAVQGPPGAGKTFTGAQMICALVASGRRVGVMATGHSVIRNLLCKVVEGAAENGDEALLIGHKVDERSEDAGPIVEFTDNAPALKALRLGEINALGGTAWMWSRPEFAKSVDVLFVDEAGQVSLANALAVTAAAHNVVLLGDPQQLEQSKKGTHPEGTGVSSLQHLLGDHLTIPESRGIFLPETWRLAPRIASFTSETFYERRLRSRPGLELQRLLGNRFAGSGLWIVDVEHDGNRNASDEEVAIVDRLVTLLTAGGSTWIDKYGSEVPLRPANILVVAPFNAQVGRLAEALAPRGVRVGTVDKFQGQEAAVAIYSMATSRPEDAPRGLEFLYSLNRFNVATSRARCAAFVVASPRLIEPDCRTPHQIRLANALCRYREVATVLDSSSL